MHCDSENSSTLISEMKIRRCFNCEQGFLQDKALLGQPQNIFIDYFQIILAVMATAFNLPYLSVNK